MKIPVYFVVLLFRIPFGASLKCYVCHKDITNCTGVPSASHLRECDDEITSCFTQADHFIVRGCFHSESGLSLRAFTRLCDADGCNNEPFIGASQLKCQVCTEGERCESDLMDCSHDVILYRRDFCYAAWSSDGKQVVKGCLLEASENIQKLCNPMDVHRDRCLTCQYDGCNRNLQPNRSTRCMSSAIKSGVDCKSYRMSDRAGCFVRNNGDDTIAEMGCNTQLSEEDFQDCADLANDTCQLCMTPMCNNLRQKKLQTCAFGKTPTALSPKICKRADDRCVLYDAFGQSLYNCESSILCLTQFCYFCTGRLCNWNMQPYRSCHVCNSTESCRQDLQNVDEFKALCTPSNRPDHEYCYSVVDDKNQIYRGCYAEQQSLCDKFSAKCIKCTGNYCNSQPAVQSSLVCYSCGQADRQCGIERSSLSATTKCLDRFRGQLESCYQIHDLALKRVERGCALDIPRDRMWKQSMFSYCDSHFCNSEGYETRKCINCRGVELDSKCHTLGADAVNLVQDCETAADRIEASACYSLFLNQSIVWRGCHVEMPSELVDFCQANMNKLCHTCTKDVCNKVRLWFESCYICHRNCTVHRDDDNETNSTMVEPRACENISTETKRGCYIMISGSGAGGGGDAPGKSYKQGCISDLTREEFEACQKDANSCQMCEGSACNRELRVLPALKKGQEGDSKGTMVQQMRLWGMSMGILFIFLST